MPNPKHKHTRSRRDSRRSQNWKLEVGTVSKCSNCAGPRQSHRVCPSCGFYGGKLVVAQKTKKKEGGEGEKK